MLDTTDASTLATLNNDEAAKKTASPYWLPETRAIIVSWMMISSFVLVVLCWWRPPPADNQIVTMLVSVYVSTGFVTALQWWMGSSKGSDDKSTAINNQLSKGP